MRRCARRLRRAAVRRWNRYVVVDGVGGCVLNEVSASVRTRTRRLRGCDSAGAVLLAAGVAADDASFKFSGAVTLMRCFAPAAGVRWRSQSLHRQRKKTSGKREDQEQSGSQALHLFWWSVNPKLVENRTAKTRGARFRGRDRDKHLHLRCGRLLLSSRPERENPSREHECRRRDFRCARIPTLLNRTDPAT